MRSEKQEYRILRRPIFGQRGVKVCAGSTEGIMIKDFCLFTENFMKFTDKFVQQVYL